MVISRSGVRVVVIVIVLVSLSARTAGAQQETPVVRIANVDGFVAYPPDCGERPVVPAGVKLERTGPTDASLSVAYDVTGPVETPHGTAEFAPGSTHANITIRSTVSDMTKASVQITLVDGDDYDLGTPATAGVNVIFYTILCPTSTTSVATTTTAPSAITSSETLPRTGATNSTGLILISAAFVGAGSLLLIRRRKTA